MDSGTPTTGPLILVVDDNHVDLTLMQRMLPKFNFRVVLAENGEKALALAESEKPDLVLLDIILPHMSGVEVCKRLKANPVTQGIPVIFFSGIELPKKFINYQEVGAVDFLSKTQPASLIAERITVALKNPVASKLPEPDAEPA